VLQVWGSYRLITQTFKWLTLALFAYVGAALYTRPDPWEILRGTLIPTVSFDARFLATLVAILGTTISPYLFFWQASQEVEEEISMGRRTLKARQGATYRELGYASVDVTTGMFFSNVVIAALLAAMHDAAVRLDTDASRLNTGHEEMTDLLLPEEHAQPFREWLQRAVMRWSSAGDHAKAQAFARLHGSERGSGLAWPRSLTRPVLASYGWSRVLCAGRNWHRKLCRR
jgi:Natural resistance-associated macrophage protein